jgi:magnesium transporter
MPSLPRPLRRGTRSRALDATRPPEPDTPNLEILEAEGLRWINIVRPRPSDRAWLEEHFAFHPLDYEDVFSRNQRPKVDEYDDYLFVVLHFPRYDKTIGRLNAAELDVFIGRTSSSRCPTRRCSRCSTCGPLLVADRPARVAVQQGRRLPALQDRRRLRRRLVPDAREDGQQARAHRGRHLRGPLGEVVRDISDVKQEIINFRKIVRPQRAR